MEEMDEGTDGEQGGSERRGERVQRRMEMTKLCCERNS
jgi:hypothetical protein